MSRLEELITEMEALLNQYAEAGYFLNAPVESRDHDEQGEMNCALCGKRYLPEMQRWVSQFDHKQYTDWKYAVGEKLSRGSDYSWWPVCSEACQNAGDRLMTIVKQRRKHIWAGIVESRRLLKEARSWLKNHEASQSQNAE
jgi:hypothetical protein